MKWKDRPTPPMYSHKRTKRAFLWFPKKIGGETRWLETASWKERYLPTHHYSDDPSSWVAMYWINE